MRILAKSTAPNDQNWRWFEATLIGGLALIGLDILTWILLGVGVGIAQTVGWGNGDISTLESNISLNFGLFAVSRLSALALVLTFIRRRGISLRQFGFKSFRLLPTLGRLIISSLSLIAVSTAVFYLGELLWPSLNLEQAQEVVFNRAQGTGQLVMAFVALVIIAPVVEEVIFRGLLLPAYVKRWGIWAGTLVTSLLFGLVHWQLNVGIITFIMGLLLAWLYLKSRSLWPAIMFHSLKNLLAFYLIF